MLFAAFERLGPVAPPPPPPPGTLLVAGDALPLPLRRFGEAPAAAGPVVSFPPDGAVVEGPDVLLRVEDGVAPFTWLANGAPVATTRRREVTVEGLGLGFSRLTVVDGAGRAASATVEVAAPL